MFSGKKNNRRAPRRAQSFFLSSSAVSAPSAVINHLIFRQYPSPCSIYNLYTTPRFTIFSETTRKHDAENHDDADPDNL